MSNSQPIFRYNAHRQVLVEQEKMNEPRQPSTDRKGAWELWDKDMAAYEAHLASLRSYPVSPGDWREDVNYVEGRDFNVSRKCAGSTQCFVLCDDCYTAVLLPAGEPERLHEAAKQFALEKKKTLLLPLTVYDLFDAFLAGAAHMQAQSAGVWVRARERLPQMERPIVARLDGCTLRTGNFFEDRGDCKFFVNHKVGFLISSDKFCNIEWLDESLTPSAREDLERFRNDTKQLIEIIERFKYGESSSIFDAVSSFKQQHNL